MESKSREAFDIFLSCVPPSTEVIYIDPAHRAGADVLDGAHVGSPPLEGENPPVLSPSTAVQEMADPYFVSHKVFSKSFFKRQLPHKSVNLSFTITIRQLVLHVSDSKGQADGFVGELTSAKKL